MKKQISFPRICYATELFPDAGLWKPRDRMSACNDTASQPRLLQSVDTSPTPGRFNDRTNLNPDGESDLTTTVLELIRSDNPKLKTSTKLQLRHKIGMKLDK
jgi:hypothetical protein